MFGRNKSVSGLPGSNVAPVGSNEILERLAEDYMKDRKWRRYLKVGFFLLVVVYVIAVLSVAGGSAKSAGASKPHTAVVSLNGVIGGGKGILAKQINHSLRRAFESKQSQAVILHANSPGGSPVQSAEINEEILRLRELYPSKQIITVMSDVCASGCYYVAVASDEIYANKSSIVGSIGVRMDSFGFVGLLDKIGVERRSLTAGENKAILDPFLPTQPSQQAHAQTMLGIVHQQFIDVVKQGRGDKLADNPDLFSGLFWAGETAKTLGLVDDFGSVDYVAREVIGEENLVDYSYRPSWLEEVSDTLGVSIGKDLSSIFSSKIQLQ